MDMKRAIGTIRSFEAAAKRICRPPYSLPQNGIVENMIAFIDWLYTGNHGSVANVGWNWYAGVPVIECRCSDWYVKLRPSGMTGSVFVSTRTPNREWKERCLNEKLHDFETLNQFVTTLAQKEAQ